MDEQQSGLRFDIYERVHLNEDRQSIGELQDIELTPHIQVFRDRDQAILKGHLKLAGTYTSEESEDSREEMLEHYIPVEISLPLHRIRKTNEISVTIDNFDVDVLSSRSMNVTGVLSLEGIEFSSQTEDYEEGREQVYIHQADADADAEQKDAAAEVAEEPAARPEGGKQETVAEQRKENEPETTLQPNREETGVKVNDSEDHVPVNSDMDFSEVYRQDGALAAAPTEHASAEADAPAEKAADVQKPVNSKSSKLDGPSVSAERPAADVLKTQSVLHDSASDTPNEGDEEASVSPERIEPTVEDTVEASAELDQNDNDVISNEPAESNPASAKKPVKIAFASIKEDASPKVTAQENELASEEAGLQDDVQDDKLEWKKLFLSGNEEMQFRKLKMCIVQKDETLDAIAERYQINPREIILYNRLEQDDLESGQIIYIPKTG